MLTERRIVVVTGGFGALGSVVAEAFRDAGDAVVRVDFAASPAAPLLDVLDIGGVDLTDGPAVDELIAKICDKFGSITILVNIAGGFIWQTLAEGDLANWDRMYRMNLGTVMTMTKAALPALSKSSNGRIINIGAGAALKADAGMGAYAASKAGVHRFTESLAAECGGRDITVNALLPTIIDTPANRADMPDADTSDWISPRALADVILFLASPASRAINGALIPVTRGGA